MNGTKLYKLVINNNYHRPYFKEGALKHTVVDFKNIDQYNKLMILEMDENDIEIYKNCGFDIKDLKEY